MGEYVVFLKAESQAESEVLPKLLSGELSGRK